ncbi:MAG: glycosyltransferase family 4 protein [Anaerolineae bacterium]|nr:glycosyltransferase family 4 protein [Anaerolineae bacterium]
MHILMVTSYFEPDSGAAAVRLSRLARLLHRRGHEVTVLTTLPHYPEGRIQEGYQGAWEVEENRSGVRVIQTWLWATPSARISRKFLSQITFMLTAALRGLRLPRPDVIFIEAQPVFTCMAAVFIARMLRVPYVMHVSAMWPEHLLSVGALTEDHPVYRIARAVVDEMYRGAAAISTLSPNWVDDIQRYVGPRDAVQFIDNGVDLERFHPGLDDRSFRERHNLPLDKRLVTFIGTFATQYDFEVMFEVARRLTDHPDVLFVFIGGGSQSELVEQQLASGEPANLRWLGLIDREEIPQAWAASQLTYLSFRDQDLYRGTIPGKFFEAMACGVPIAAGLEGIGGEILQASGAGIAVDFANADTLTDAVTRLLDDADFRHQCSEAGRRYAESHYDPEVVAAAHEAVLLQAARKS